MNTPTPEPLGDISDHGIKKKAPTVYNYPGSPLPSAIIPVPLPSRYAYPVMVMANPVIPADPLIEGARVGALFRQAVIDAAELLDLPLVDVILAHSDTLSIEIKLRYLDDPAQF